MFSASCYVLKTISSYIIHVSLRIASQSCCNFAASNNSS